MSTLDLKNWTKLKELGSGGQATVWLAQKKENESGEHADRCEEFCEAIGTLPQIADSKSRQKLVDKIRDYLKDVGGLNPTLGALKVLHDPEEARDAENAADRMKSEIQTMAACEHPNLLKIIEHSDSLLTYVSEFHEGGVLSSSLAATKGDALKSLNLIRPLVEGLMILHEKRAVHRDIKPDNIFLCETRGLVLGDFGLVFLNNDRTRHSGTFENVGSRDWMPGWAYGMRIDSIQPDFDVFSLGKVLWSMISGIKILQLWYFDKPNFNLTKLFPNQPEMELVNEFLSKCIVENQEDCLVDAKSMLVELDTTIKRIEKSQYSLTVERTRPCIVCSDGNYGLKVDRSHAAAGNFGIEGRGQQAFRIFVCNECGHVQLFSCTRDFLPPAWKS